MNADLIERAERALDSATDRLGRLAGSAPLGKRRQAETIYGQAYQELVRLGARRQLRAKYRRA